MNAISKSLMAAASVAVIGSSSAFGMVGMDLVSTGASTATGVGFTVAITGGIGGGQDPVLTISNVGGNGSTVDGSATFWDDLKQSDSTPFFTGGFTSTEDSLTFGKAQNGVLQTGYRTLTITFSPALPADLLLSVSGLDRATLTFPNNTVTKLSGNNSLTIDGTNKIVSDSTNPTTSNTPYRFPNDSNGALESAFGTVKVNGSAGLGALVIRVGEQNDQQDGFALNWVVPEPTSAGLILGSLALLAPALRRRTA